MAKAYSQRTIDASLDRDAAALHDALSALVRVYQFRDRDKICCHDISVTQCYALDGLVRHGPLTMNQLASHLYLDKSTVSRVVNAMERKGLIVRSPHSDDRRAVMLEPTEEGRQLCNLIRRDLEQQEKRLIADFEPQTRTAMIELIGRLARAAEERVDTAGGTCCSID